MPAHLHETTPWTFDLRAQISGIRTYSVCRESKCKSQERLKIIPINLKKLDSTSTKSFEPGNFIFGGNNASREYATKWRKQGNAFPPDFGLNLQNVHIHPIQDGTCGRV